jgi:hypothetical protein
MMQFSSLVVRSCLLNIVCSVIVSGCIKKEDNRISSGTKTVSKIEKTPEGEIYEAIFVHKIQEPSAGSYIFCPYYVKTELKREESKSNAPKSDLYHFYSAAMWEPIGVFRSLGPKGQEDVPFSKKSFDVVIDAFKDKHKKNRAWKFLEQVGNALRKQVVAAGAGLDTYLTMSRSSNPDIEGKKAVDDDYYDAEMTVNIRLDREAIVNAAAVAAAEYEVEEKPELLRIRNSGLAFFENIEETRTVFDILTMFFENTVRFETLARHRCPGKDQILVEMKKWQQSGDQSL